jgi:GntR family transcriptional repressor for pyruvate dehydrogenase complex
MIPTDRPLVDAVLQPVRDQLAFESCVEQLGSAIRLGVFRPGDKLPTERDLAARLGVSRSTMREAMSALRAAGMVVTTRGRGGGSVIAEPSPAGRTAAEGAMGAGPSDTDLDDLLIFRRVVEPGACEVAASRPVDAAARDLLLRTLEECDGSHPPAEYRQADARLHLAIAACCGSAELTKAVSWVQTRVHQYLEGIPFLAANIAGSDIQHAAIVHAIIAGDPGTARTTMENHCDATAALLKGLHR